MSLRKIVEKMGQTPFIQLFKRLDKWCLSLFFLFSVLCPLTAYANNIQVSNVSLQNMDATAGTADIKFDLTWENNFSGTDANSQAFFDRAWVFVKFWKDGWATDGTVAWKHATFTSGGSVTTYSASSGTGVTSDGKGAFCAPGANQTVKWNFTADSISSTDTIQVKVMAIEMVYIPQGEFYVGSGGTESGSFTNGSWTSGATIPLKIASEGELTIAQSAGNLWGTSTSGNNTIGGAGTLPAAYPKGFNAFYVMKYEVSQGQYRDFLNTLSRAQQNRRIASQAANQFMMPNTSAVSYRNGLRNPASIPSGAITFGCDLDADGVFNEAADGEWIACNYLSWIDLAAYADWAGLRPMTELEFEKASRGGSPTNNAVANELVWGNITADYFSDLTDSGKITEAKGPTRPGANCNYSSASPDGPIRCGMFATSASTRAQAGASYYGAMELSGNNWERPVTVGNNTSGTVIGGRAFTGTHGDGLLTTLTSYEGNATNSDWPGYDTAYSTRGVNGATGSGFRGGNWSIDTSNARVSDRYYAAFTFTNRYYDIGGRAVRTSP